MTPSRHQLLGAVRSCIDDLREVPDDPHRLLAAAKALARLDAASETAADRVVAACLAKVLARVVARDTTPRSLIRPIVRRTFADLVLRASGGKEESCDE